MKQPASPSSSDGRTPAGALACRAPGDGGCRHAHSRDRPRQGQPDAERARPARRRLSRDRKPGDVRRHRRPGDVACQAPIAASRPPVHSPATSTARTCWRRRWRCCASSIQGCDLGAVELEKNLPVAAGLGGGSADAAALLRAVRRANPERAGRIDWHALAARLGADVPVCLDGVPALMCGIGDRVAAAGSRAANAASRLPSSSIRECRCRRRKSSERSTRLLPFPVLHGKRVGAEGQRAADWTRSLPTCKRGAMTWNARQFRSCPSSQTSRRRLPRSPDAGIAAMSGSGPTCFGIFGDDASAARCRGRARARASGLVDRADPPRQPCTGGDQFARLTQKPMTSVRALALASAGKMASASRAMAP